MRIGLDFDNTLIRYDAVFHDLAVSRGWVAPGFPVSKEAVKARLIEDDGDDLRWQRLQAEAYGRRVEQAEAFPGALEFVQGALAAGHQLFIVSHKTAVSNLDPEVPLREAAARWLQKRVFVGAAAIPEGNVVFTSTREEKVEAIGRLELDLFVDDLACVLEHPAFPRDTARLRFAPAGGDKGPALAQVASWAEAREQLRCLERIGARAYRALVEAFESKPQTAELAAKGGNNRVVKVVLEDGRAFVVKRYLVDGVDRRARAKTEHWALSLLHENGVDNVPTPHLLDERQEFAILSWLEGRPMRELEVAREHVLQAAQFLERLQSLHQRTLGQALPEGADSRRRLADYPALLERRLSRIREGLRSLSGAAELRAFVEGEVAPLKEALVERFERAARAQGLELDAPIPEDERTLSPSDFGFHNAVLGADGRVQFLDFEYFGRDDTAKLAADFVHHVAQTLPAEHYALFLDELRRRLNRAGAFEKRLALVDDLIALEWVLIVLNVLSPDALARRKFSDPDADGDALIGQRLRKARELVARIKHSEDARTALAAPARP